MFINMTTGHSDKMPPRVLAVESTERLGEMGSSHRGSVGMNLTSIRENAGLIPGLAQWVKDPALCEWWCRSQMWLGSRIAVAVV